MAKVSNSQKISRLKKYFQKEPQVLLAFLFGSQAKGRQMEESDWDIGLYFKPKEYLELEAVKEEYPKEDKIWSDLIRILETDNVDFVVLNRARPSLVYNVLRTGVPLTMKDRKLYLGLLCKTFYEAMDWWQFVFGFYKIKQSAKSLSLEAKTNIKERLDFLEEQFKDLERFKKLTWPIYRADRNERRNVEKWVENLAMASIDIAQIILASEKKEIPQSYKDTLKVFTGLTLKFPLEKAETFSEFAKLRNIVVHEYLDIKWERIKNFIQKAEELYPRFIGKVKSIVE